MKVIITEHQLKTLLEVIKNDKVICDNCGWSWYISDGGDDPYICHKCWYDNSEKEYTGKRVMVYYNLRKHTFSVTLKDKVIFHSDYLKLRDVEFRVRKGGKDRVRSEKSKNVHAFVIGNLIDYCEYPCNEIPAPTSDEVITYDPYKYDSFVYKKNGEEIFDAKEVEMINLKNKIFLVKK